MSRRARFDTAREDGFMFFIQDKEAGNIIEQFNTLEEAQKCKKEWAEEDYEDDKAKTLRECEDFYEIVSTDYDDDTEY